MSNKKRPYEFAIACSKVEACELWPVHLRIQDIYKLWHKVLKHYHKPEEFRTYLNSCIQELRNLTFVLQANKSTFIEFESWYSKWQDYFREDEILRWIVNARNKVVKQGDLETQSIARASILNSYREPDYEDIEIDPFVLIGDLIDNLQKKDIPVEDVGQGYIKVTRRWVVEDLEEHELLEALAYAFSKMVKLVIGAHNHLKNENEGTNFPTNPDELSHLDGKAPLMIEFEEQATQLVKLSAGKVTSITKTPNPEVPGEVVEERYGHPKDIFTKSEELTLEAAANMQLEMAKRALEIDKSLVPVALLLSENGGSLQSLKFDDESEKYLMWRSLGNEVKRRDAHTVVALGEVWVRKIPEDIKGPIFKKDIEPTEAIAVEAISKKGENFILMQHFEKDDDGEIIFGEFSKDVEGHSFYLDPIRRAWNID